MIRAEVEGSFAAFLPAEAGFGADAGAGAGVDMGVGAGAGAGAGAGMGIESAGASGCTLFFLRAMSCTCGVRRKDARPQYPNARL